MSTPVLVSHGPQIHPPSVDVLMRPVMGPRQSPPPSDLREACLRVRRSIAACLLEIEALGKAEEEGFNEVRVALGRLNLILVREEFRVEDSPMDTCRIVEAQLRETKRVLADYGEKVRGVAYISVSRLDEDWEVLVDRLQDFTKCLEDFEIDLYHGKPVHTPIAYPFPARQERTASILLSWLGGLFGQSTTRLQ